MSQALDLQPLRSYLRTTYDMRMVLAPLEELQQAFYKQKQPFIETLDKQIPFPLSDTLKQMASKEKIDLANPTQAQEFFVQMQKAIQQIPVVHVTMSFQPTIALINTMIRWLSENITSFVILDFDIDRTLIGSAKIQFNGKYKDYSIKKRLAEHPMDVANQEQTNG